MVQGCPNLLRVFKKGTSVADGIADLTHVATVNTGNLFNGNALITTVYLPDGVTSLDKQFATAGATTIYIPDTCSSIAGIFEPATETTSKVDDFAFGSKTTITLVQKTYNADLVASMENYVAESLQKSTPVEFTFVYLDANGNAHVAPAE